MAVLERNDYILKNILITGRSTAFDKKLASIFVREGHNVFIPNPKLISPSKGICLHDESHTAFIGKGCVDNKPIEKIDIYIDTSDKRYDLDNFRIRDGLDEKIMIKTYKANVIEPMKLLDRYLPLLDKGDDKRLCFLSSAEASINETLDTTGFAYKMSKAAIHNLFMIAWNTLESDGYTFRVYDPMRDKINVKDSAEGAFIYFTKRRGMENDDSLRDDENRLVMRDALGREHAW